MDCPSCNGTGQSDRPGTGCFLCDGTGVMCDVCGESAAACICAEADDDDDLFDDDGTDEIEDDE